MAPQATLEILAGRDGVPAFPQCDQTIAVKLLQVHNFQGKISPMKVCGPTAKLWPHEVNLCLPYLLVFPLIALPPILIIYNNGCDEVIARRHHSSIEFIPSLVHPARKNLSRISSRIHLPSYSSSKYLSNIDSLSSQPASLLSGSKIQLQK